MKDENAEFWTEETSVLFTSLYGWTPETWGTVGWTGDRGRTRRANLLRELSDPFITVCYVTSNKNYIDPGLKGMIAGFYLVSHQCGDRNEFTHAMHHDRYPEQWQHSLKALRAFSYFPEHRLRVAQLNPALLERARTVASMCEVLTDAREIRLLRETPWIEVGVFGSPGQTAEPIKAVPEQGYVKAGPANEGSYIVSAAAARLERQLYVLRLNGDIDGYLGRPCNGCAIFKIGLSVSPDLRRQGFQNAMPRGAYKWSVECTTSQSGFSSCASFDAAVAGEDAMKKHLTRSAEWLGGEFYLASEAEIEEAWRLGHEAISSFGRKA